MVKYNSFSQVQIGVISDLTMITKSTTSDEVDRRNIIYLRTISRVLKVLWTRNDS
jgi:hypothetical protein